ncbi:MAG: AAA family ATPase, partial [Candidatus Sericytochromatia bacterium]|nr:AAA family ATPase [Candidatus Sericytochromatia bacterium]
INKDESIHKINLPEEIHAIFGEMVIQEPQQNIVNSQIIDDLGKKLSSIATLKRISNNPIVTSKETRDTDQPLNQIFYGPSGSGKTYKTISSALEIIDGFFPEDFTEAKKRFDYYRDVGQISFITFHKSYKYDDFMEGVKSFISEDSPNQTDYKVKSGIFKEITSLAKVELVTAPNKINFSPEDQKVNFFKITIGTKSRERDDQTLSYCLDNNHIALDLLGGIDYSIIENTKDWEQAKEEISEIYFYEQSEEEKRLGIQAIYYFKNFMKKDDIVFVSNDHNKIIAIGRITGRYEFFDIAGIRYHHFRNVEWLIKNCNIPSEKFYKNKFSEQIIYQLNRDTFLMDNVTNFISSKNNRKRNYVLIIDEINKGNVSEIFGESLTLIEPQRRLGQNEELTIRLPYSNDEFGIPDNLYIIGTMNASQNIEVFDQNFRRRFDFIELDINYDLLKFKIDGIEIDKMLMKINERIEYISDEQLRIGHSYFIELKDNPSFEALKNTFKNKIIPLLQYYFFEDIEKIYLILGDNNKKDQSLQFVQQKKINIKNLFGNNAKIKNRNIDDKNLYKFNSPNDPNAFIQIYKKTESRI